MPDLFKQDYPTVTRSYRCRCGNNRFYVEPEKPPHGNHLRCTNCDRGGFWMEKPKPTAPKSASLDFTQWVKACPYPDLQELVNRYGTYAAISVSAWAAYDQAREDWNNRRLERLGGPTAATRDALAEIRSRPSRKRARK